MSTLELKTKILPGGRIEVQAPGLVEGQEVTVRIVVEDGAPKQRINDILAGYEGGQLFKTAAEVDQYIKEERESWHE
jgi:hypothetical protein